MLLSFAEKLVVMHFSSFLTHFNKNLLWTISPQPQLVATWFYSESWPPHHALGHATIFEVIWAKLHNLVVNWAVELPWAILQEPMVKKINCVIERVIWYVWSEPDKKIGRNWCVEAAGPAVHPTKQPHLNLNTTRHSHPNWTNNFSHI